MIAPRTIALAGVVLLLLVSLPGATVLPVGPFIGLDFHNVDVFHACAVRDNPYLGTGVACGDELGRDMYFPPLMYASFAWTRLVPLSTGAAIWAAGIVVGLLLALSAWVPRGHHGARLAIFIGLMLLQFPVIYAVERGNNDIVVVVTWTIAAFLFLSGRIAPAGFLAGLSAVLKLYPAFAGIVVGIGLLAAAWRRTDARRPLIAFVAGGLAAGLLAVGLLFEQHVAWATDELVRLVAWETELDVTSHAIGHIAPGGISAILSLPLLAVWGWASARRLASDPALVFAGGLAISTYFSALSNDYNLITTYPLLLLLFVRATSVQAGWLSFGLLVLGLVGIVGNRQWFEGSDELAVLHTGLQWLWLIATGAAVALAPERLRVAVPAPTLREAADSASVPLPPRTTFSSLRDT